MKKYSILRFNRLVALTFLTSSLLDRSEFLNSDNQSYINPINKLLDPTSPFPFQIVNAKISTTITTTATGRTKTAFVSAIPSSSGSYNQRKNQNQNQQRKTAMNDNNQDQIVDSSHTKSTSADPNQQQSEQEQETRQRPGDSGIVDISEAGDSSVPLLQLPPSDPNDKSIPSIRLGETIRFEEWGPIILNTDGTTRRIENWDQLTEQEKKVTWRRISKRNEERRLVLLQQQQEQQEKENTEL